MTNMTRSSAPSARTFWKSTTRGWKPAGFPRLADAAGLRRVDSYTGKQMFARKSGDLGIIIPYLQPGENRVVEYRTPRRSSGT